MKLHNPFKSGHDFVEIASKLIVVAGFFAMLAIAPQITLSLIIAGVVGRVVYYIIKGE